MWCNGVYFVHLLSRRAMQLSPLTLTLATFSIPYHQWKGSGFKKGVCEWCSMPWVSCLGRPLVWLPFLEESRLFGTNHSFQFKCQVHSGCLQQQAIMDKVLQAAAVVAAFLLLLGILHCPGKEHCQFLSYAFNAIGVFTLSTFFFVGALFLLVCHPYSRGPGRLGAFQL